MKAVFGWVLGLLFMAGAFAHHGPEELVAEFTAKLEAQPDNIEWLSRRATEYRALGMHAEAEADLRRVVGKKPELVAETESLARVLWAQAKRDEAMTFVKQVVTRSSAGRERAAGLILQSEWELERGNLAVAMEVCEEAFEEDPAGMVDWYLLRSRIQERTGALAERVADLQIGYDRLDSVVLRNARVDAALDGEMFENLSPLIEEELEKSRLKSSWLIRRGRLRLGLHEEKAAWKDLNAAIMELDRRIHPERPDAKLIIDRGWARLYLENAKVAKDDLSLARKHGGDPWEIERLAAALQD